MIHSTKISGNRVSPTRKVSKKSVLLRWTPFLGWTGPIKMDHTIWSFQHILYPMTSLFVYLPCTKWRKILITTLLSIVNSWSIGVTRTFMFNYHSSIAASQAKCMFWLLTALKTIYFPREFGMFYSSFDSGERVVWSHNYSIHVYRGMVCSK